MISKNSTTQCSVKFIFFPNRFFKDAEKRCLSCPNTIIIPKCVSDIHSKILDFAHNFLGHSCLTHLSQLHNEPDHLLSLSLLISKIIMKIIKIRGIKTLFLIWKHVRFYRFYCNILRTIRLFPKQRYFSVATYLLTSFSFQKMDSLKIIITSSTDISINNHCNKKTPWYISLKIEE